ncbi:MAG: TlpA disulfide reductase family protein [bacterium]|nr:TlpA disulfide reductase family protein [bacterium]
MVTAFVAGLTGLFVFGLLRGAPDRNVPSNLLDRTVPTFELGVYEPLQAEFGPLLDLADHGDRPKVINFWASWCIPCYEEAPHLQAVHEVFGDRVLFIGIQTQDREARAAGRAFINRFGFTFPNLFDADSRVSIAYGVFGVPETYFVRADGSLSYKHVGPVTVDIMTTQVEALLR